MTSPRALASRSPILALLACVLAVASAAPTSAEERGTDLSAEVSAHARRLSETLRSSITPELISALGEGIAPGRPEPHVRGRSLADVGICEWVQKDADYDHAYGCLLRPSVVNDFKPETVKGRTGFEILKPIVTCLDVEDKEECQMRPSCIWYPAGGRYAEDTCDGDFNSILTAKIPANECASGSAQNGWEANRRIRGQPMDNAVEAFLRQDEQNPIRDRPRYKIQHHT